MLVGQRLRNAVRAETARIRKGSEIGIRTRPGPRGRNVFGAPAAAANDPGDEHRAEAEHRCSHVGLTPQLAARFHSSANDPDDRLDAPSSSRVENNSAQATTNYDSSEPHSSPQVAASTLTAHDEIYDIARRGARP
jgi:hypothetical protein